MAKFEIGDTVRCVEGARFITEGRCYEVRGVCRSGRIRIKDNDGDHAYYRELRFEKVNEMKKLKKGDWVVALLEEGADVTKGRRYKVSRVYKWLGEMRAEFRDDVGDSRSFGLEGNRFERVSKMNETEEYQAKISQNAADQAKLKEEQERLEAELAKTAHPKVMYSVGDRFRQAAGIYKGTKHILVNVGGVVAIVGLDDGIVWCPGSSEIVNDARITPAEFRILAGCDSGFERCWDSIKGKEV